MSFFPIPLTSIEPNTRAFESTPLVKPTGFREYDAPGGLGHPASPKAPEINLMASRPLAWHWHVPQGAWCRAASSVGHDFRLFRLDQARAGNRVDASGCKVVDIGLALSPMAYFAQFALDVPAVAMVTASHNDNGWTGVKMGCNRPVTFGRMK